MESSANTGMPANSSASRLSEVLLGSLERFWALWCYQRRYPNAVVVLSAGIFLLALALTVYAGALHIQYFGHDVFIFLDGAWRVLNGQRPHADFSTGFGPVSYLIFAFGLKLSGLEVAGLGYSRAAVGLVIGIWSFLLLRHRLSRTPLVVVFLYLLCLTVAPFPIGLSPRCTTHAMFYDRYGYALLALIMVEAFRFPHTPPGRRWQEFAGGVSTGVALCLLLFLKISCFPVAVVVVGWSFVTRPSGQRALALFCGVVPAVLLMLSYLRFDVNAVVRDLSMVAAARKSHVRIGTLTQATYLSSAEIAVVLLVTVLVCLFGVRKVRDCVRYVAFALLAIAASAVLLTANTQTTGNPLLAVAAVVLLNELIFAFGKLSHENRQKHAAAAAVIVLFGLAGLVQSMLVDAAGVAYAAVQKSRIGYPERTVVRSSAHARSMAFVGSATGLFKYETGPDLVAVLEDGIALLRRHTTPDDGVISFGINNPFSYLLLRKPPAGGSSWLQYWASFSNNNRVPESLLFRGARAVMAPTYEGYQTAGVEKLLEYHKSILEEEFYLAGESSFWRLYVRNTGSR